MSIEAAGGLQGGDHALGAVLVGHHVDAQVQPLQAFGGGRTDGADAWAVQVADVAHPRQRPAHEVVDAVGTGEHEPVIRADAGDGAVDLVVVVERFDVDRGCLDHLGAEIGQSLHELAGLFA